jgi:hypothetical protein
MAPAAARPTSRTWSVPLSRTGLTLAEAYAGLGRLALRQQQVPFLVQLIENPRFDLPGVDLFHGATDLKTHDYLHILLGRGLLPKDEAFVLGFTMGSTNRVSETEERLYAFFTRYLYPKAYRFTPEDLQVFKDAVRLAYISDCCSLAEADYAALLELPLQEARRSLGIEVDLLQAYYRIEQRRYPDAVESQRLLV